MSFRTLRCMRTTLTLDRDVAAQLARVRTTLRDLVNEALRLGLKEMTTPTRSETAYRTRTVDLGRCLVGSLDDVAEVLASAETQSY